MIDIVVPVYRSLAATRRCIESVLAAPCAEPREVVVIDDASPEPALSAWLRVLAQEGRITLLAHPANTGFVASANEGMALHPDRDVVLLNSDTQVAPGWLDRLAACARREPNVATVTPFTNNGSLCSYPRFAAPNALPRDMDTAALDALFADVNRGVAIDIPVGVGFCLYVRRAAIEIAGPFDEAAFGRGYGEEVDFCMRAARAGLRNLLAADVFVFHEGEVSFGADGSGRRAAAQAIVDERYPEFQPIARDFVAREPLLQYRRRVDLERLRRSPLPRVLFVTHSWHGGVERHVQDLARLLESHAEVLVMRPAPGERVTVQWQRPDAQLQAWFEPATQWSACIELLRTAGIDRVHYHHVHGLPEQVLDLPSALGAPYDVTLHDYFPICPRYHLSHDARHFCGGRDGSVCDHCLDEAPAQWPMTLAQWRARFHAWLLGAARVIAPSADLAARLRGNLPDVDVLVWPHPEAPSKTAPVFKVALLGAVSAVKGARVLEECVEDAKARGLPLHFHVIGHVDRPMATWPDAPLTIGGSYPDEHLASAIELARPEAFLFLSQVPETYSYTLTQALRSGLPVVAPRLGAFPERLAGCRHATLFPPEASAGEINDAILARLEASRSPLRLQAATEPR
ncbi:MAG TPA: glycosyltransferase [Usitatibacter sp.]|nr:glycosyltransferase [Usitatibacter sp.]